MVVTTPEEFFKEVLPTKFDPKKAEGVDSVIQMNITGENGGSWNLTIRDQSIEIKEGVHPSPTITVKMKDKDYVDMVNGKLSGEKAFITGKLRFKGDLSSGLKLRGLGIL